MPVGLPLPECSAATGKCRGWECSRPRPTAHSPLEERSHSQEAARGRGALRGSRWRPVPASSGSGQSAARLRLAPLGSEPTRFQGVHEQVNGTGRTRQKAGKRRRREGRGVDERVLGWSEEAVQG